MSIEGYELRMSIEGYDLRMSIEEYDLRMSIEEYDMRMSLTCLVSKRGEHAYFNKQSEVNKESPSCSLKTSIEPCGTIP